MVPARLATCLLLVSTSPYMAGCFAVPWFGDYRMPYNDPRPESHVGEHRDLIPNESTRSDAQQVLGPATLASADERRLAYEYRVNTWGWFWIIGYPRPLAYEPRWGTRYLILDFDEQGTLQQAHVTSQLHDSELNRVGSLYGKPYEYWKMPREMGLDFLEQDRKREAGPDSRPVSQPR